ncbi:2-carboxy-1,4-naphthoquinone phytyltransferase, chloroplastic [Impatiens glandulifera]|uniref:2-carboxy-1,4-naphthoquinone phytyltransferase, chloroplastic n=1 Tax=Impatiens glandulifera TaxID=253017 RepID=UPI001FB13014|nr:2-carboxy-1,4-naphthoquinone phytyltransferase, chloroplastic [Impatiens glandulifera]
MATAYCSPVLGPVLKKVSSSIWRHQNKIRCNPLVVVSSSDRFSKTALYFGRACTEKVNVKRMHKCSLSASYETLDEQPDSVHEEDEDYISRYTLIWRAVKLPIYSVALIPLSVGSAVAYFQTGVFAARRYFLLLAGSILIITWLNLSNDVYDFDTGADKNKKESVVNIIGSGSRTGTLIAAFMLLALGFGGLVWASIDASNIRALLLLASAVICGCIYQCPPFRLNYRALGEPLCFAAFGPFATTAFYLMQSHTRMELPITGTILAASILVGFTTTLILFCSHFHQVEGDRAVGKMSPLVIIGRRRGSVVVKVAIITLYTLLFVLGLSRALPFTCTLLCGLTMPIGNLVVNYVGKYHEDKAKIFMAKYYCVRLHSAFGVALVVGLLVSRMMINKPIIF